jgi:hypothetical protein
MIGDSSPLLQAPEFRCRAVLHNSKSVLYLGPPVGCPRRPHQGSFNSGLSQTLLLYAPFSSRMLSTSSLLFITIYSCMYLGWRAGISKQILFQDWRHFYVRCCGVCSRSIRGTIVDDPSIRWTSPYGKTRTEGGACPRLSSAETQTQLASGTSSLGTSQRALGRHFWTSTQHGSLSRSSGEGWSGQQPLTASWEGRQGLSLQAIEAFP